VKFLVDEQLPPALARFFAAKGFDCQHVRDIALERASDRQIWEYAVAAGWIVVSKDADFLAHAVRSQDGGLLWARLGNCRTRPLLEAFERQWEKIQERFEAGESVIEFY
jgi:predicted nuclease of predicted toxin-antitoxin system